MSPTSADTEPGAVPRFLDSLHDDRKRADSNTLIEMMSRVTGEAPQMWSTIVGFGRYHYRYDSGHQGEAALVGFSPRKAALSIYIMGAGLPEAQPEAQALFARLGPHTMGKACLYLKRLSDVDLPTLEALVRLSVKALRKRYPAGSDA